MAELADPAFLAECRRVRTEVEAKPEPSTKLTARYAALNDEFGRRASAAWAKAAR